MAGRWVYALLIFGGLGTSQTALANVTLDVSGTPGGFTPTCSSNQGWEFAANSPTSATPPRRFDSNDGGFDLGRDIGPNSLSAEDASIPVLPAPGTMLLAAIGTALVGWLRWRRSL